MRFNKILKKLIIALPVIAVVGCSATKNISNDQNSKDIIDTSSVRTADDNSNTYVEEQASLQMQQLHKNIIYFDLDKYNIHSKFTEILDAHADFLRNNSAYRVTIEGHADERGTPEYNIALGERRANAVKMYLQSKGVSADQISIISYGKEKPESLGHDETAYIKNRRAVLVY